MKTDSQAPGASAPKRIRHLDGLRGIAVGLVLISHFIAPLLNQAPRSPGAYVAAALTMSYTGVDLFFVLSGYLIGGILLDHRASRQFLTAFYIRRAARIMPLAYLGIVLILTAQAAGLYGNPEGGPPWTPAVYLLFTVNFAMAAIGDWGYRPLSPYWSLAIEEQFYLASPLLLTVASPRQTRWLLLSFVVIAPVTRLTLLAAGRHPLSTAMLPFCRTDSIGLGLLAAWIMRNSKARKWCQNHYRALASLGAVTGAGIALLTKIRATNGSFGMAAGGYTVVACFYTVLLLLLEMRSYSLLNRAIAAAPLVLLGRCSYFLYLFQGLVIGLTVALIFHHRLAIVSPTSLAQLAVGVAVLFTIAIVSWRWLESPILAQARRFTYEG